MSGNTEEKVCSIADNVTEAMHNLNNVNVETTGALTTNLAIPTQELLSAQILSTVALTVGVFGIITNTAVLAVLLLARQEYGSSINTLITNQSAMDLFTSASTLVIYVTMLTHGFVYSGNRLVDKVICVAIESGVFAAFGTTAAKAGLVIITLERYFKVVHAVAYRRYYRGWMTKACVALPWIGGACLYIIPAIGTTTVRNGRCMRLAVWPNKHMATVKYNSIRVV